MSRLIRALVVLIAAGAASGCDELDTTPYCRAAEPVTGCICNTGELGYEVCSNDGQDYGACICGEPPDAGR